MSKQDTAQDLRRVANFLKGMIQAADDIEAIGAMEGATAEALKARDSAVKERETALAELADVKASRKKAVAAAQKRVDDMLAAAQAQADANVANTQALLDKRTNDLITKAERQAAEMTATAIASVDAATSELVRLSGQKASLTAEVSDLEAKAKAAQAELDKLTKALEKIKAQFKIGE